MSLYEASAVSRLSKPRVLELGERFGYEAWYVVAALEALVMAGEMLS